MAGALIANPHASVSDIVISGLIGAGLGVFGGAAFLQAVAKPLIGAFTGMIANLSGQLLEA